MDTSLTSPNARISDSIKRSIIILWQKKTLRWTALISVFVQLINYGLICILTRETRGIIHPQAWNQYFYIFISPVLTILIILATTSIVKSVQLTFSQLVRSIFRFYLPVVILYAVLRVIANFYNSYLDYRTPITSPLINVMYIGRLVWLAVYGLLIVLQDLVIQDIVARKSNIFSAIRTSFGMITNNKKRIFYVYLALFLVTGLIRFTIVYLPEDLISRGILDISFLSAYPPFISTNFAWRSIGEAVYVLGTVWYTTLITLVYLALYKAVEPAPVPQLTT